MNPLFVPGSPLWISAVALIALLNVILLLFVSRNYFAARASRAAEGRPDRDRGSTFPVARLPDIARDGCEHSILPGPELEPAAVVAEHFHEAPVSPDNATSDDPTRQALAPEVAAPVVKTAATEAPVQDVLEAVRMRVEKDPTSARGLKDLIRALYLDQSMFAFSSLAEMNAADRALASSLVQAWLTDAYPVDRWEDAYHAIQDELEPGSSLTR